MKLVAKRIHENLDKSGAKSHYMLMAHTIAAPDARFAVAPCDMLDSWNEVVASVWAEYMAEYMSEGQDYPWIIGFSGGKDSTVVALAVFEALLQVSPSKQNRHVHVVSNGTQVKGPLVMARTRQGTNGAQGSDRGARRAA